jgi:hypothetical protein
MRKICTIELKIINCFIIWHILYVSFTLKISFDHDIIQLLTFNEVYSWLYGPRQWLIDQIGHFPFGVCHWLVWITELTLIHKNIRSIWCKTHDEVTDKHNDVSSECLDRLDHKNPSSSHWTRWDNSVNVCLDLKNCNIYITLYLFSSSNIRPICR